MSLPAILPFLALSPVISGLMATLIFGHYPKGKRLPGLLFHTITNQPSKELSHVSAVTFESFCSKLSQRDIATIRVGDAQQCSLQDASPPRVAITFDDGFASLHEFALPVLDKFNMTSTIFCLGRYFGDFSSWDIYANNLHLDKSKIRNISECGHEIGSHTMSHPALTLLPEASVKEELSASKKSLEDIIGKPVTSLSFPYGCWNRKIWDMAKSCGYTAATVYRGKTIAGEALFPVSGVYQFDTAEDIMQRIFPAGRISASYARAQMMSHFAQGTPLWKYRKEYCRV